MVRQTAKAGGPQQASADPARYRIEAVARAADILALLGEGAATQPETLAERLETTEAFVRSALATLERRGLARGPGEGRHGWSLGLAWLRLAEAGRRQIELSEIALPILQWMRDEVDETVMLSVRRGSRRVVLACVEGTQAIRRVRDFGVETPLYAGATGRALLTGMEPEELRSYLASVAASDGSVIRSMDVEAYALDVEAVRTRGYAITEQELTGDLCAVSAPVLDQSGRVAAAVTISAPADRFVEGLARACAQTALAGAKDLSRLIGHVN